jgi:hypothetical protein
MVAANWQRRAHRAARARNMGESLHAGIAESLELKGLGGQIAYDGGVRHKSAIDCLFNRAPK